MRRTQLIGALLRLGLRRPGLVPAMLAAGWRFRARGWYRRAPFLPLPPPAYLDWRLHTAYGGGDVVPPQAELARYLRWTARMNRRDGTR